MIKKNFTRIVFLTLFRKKCVLCTTESFPLHIFDPFDRKHADRGRQIHVDLQMSGKNKK